MKAQAKVSASGITIRFPPALRDHVMTVAKHEHRSTAAYIEQLVERDLREREEAERLVTVYVAPELPSRPTGPVAQEDDETAERFAHREATLDTLFGTR